MQSQVARRVEGHGTLFTKFQFAFTGGACHIPRHRYYCSSEFLAAGIQQSDIAQGQVLGCVILHFKFSVD
jgi:hypothetical protein